MQQLNWRLMRQQYNKPAIATKSALLCSVIFLSVALASCFDLFGGPQTEAIRVLPNSSCTKKAVLLRNDGNATVDVSLGVSVLDYDYRLTGKETGAAFVADGNGGAAFLDSASVSFTWRAADTLKVSYDKRLRIFHQLPRENGVMILYSRHQGSPDSPARQNK